MNNIVLHNKGSRFNGAENYEPGKYVLTDDWSIHQEIGGEFECLLIKARGKAIKVDYQRKVVEKSYEVEGPLWKEVVGKAAGKYDRNWGYYWGIELVLINFSYPDELTFFACTDTTRQSIKELGNLMNKELVFKSVLNKGKRFDYYGPLIMPKAIN